MDRREAMERLEAAKDFNFFGRDKVRAAIDVALEALEKQIPRKPIEEQNLMTCPVCGCQEIQYVDWFGIRKMNYCPCCSQAIDWSEE